MTSGASEPGSIRRREILGVASFGWLTITSLATAPVLARSLGVEGRGELASTLTVVFLAGVLAAGSLPDIVAREVGRGRLALADAIPVGLRASPRLLLGVTMAAALGLTLVPGPVWAALVVPGLVVAHLARGAFGAHAELGLLARERLITPTVRAGLIVAAAAMGLLTPGLAFWLSAIPVVAGGLFLAARARSGSAVSRRVSARWMGVEARRSWGITLAHAAGWRPEVLILALVGTPADVGAYVIAAALVDAPLGLGLPLQRLLLGRGTVGALPRARLVGLAGGGLSCACVLLVGAGPLIDLLAGPGFEAAIGPAQVLALAIPAAWLGAGLRARLLQLGESALAGRIQVAASVATMAVVGPAHLGAGLVGTAWVMTLSAVGAAAAMGLYLAGVGIAPAVPPTRGSLVNRGRLGAALLLTLGFTQAFTLDVGFPLKMYEPLAVILVAGFVTRRAATGNGRARWGLAEMAAVGLVSWTALSAAWWATEPLTAVFAARRFGYTFDAVASVAYGGLAVLLFLMTVSGGLGDRATVEKWWLAGAAASSIYGVAVAVASVGIDVAGIVPGQSDQLNGLGPVRYIRAGPFLEGNFWGLYLLASLGMALHLDRVRSAALFSTALVISASSLNLVGGALLWLVWGSERRSLVSLLRPDRVLLAGAGAMLGALLAGPALVAKLGGGAVSTLERRALTEVGVELALGQPLFGVGPGRFREWFPLVRPDWLPPHLLRGNTIPNNVYAQLGAEFGWLALIAFVVVLGAVGRHLMRARQRLPFATLAVMAISLNAYPSFSVAFLWVFLGWMVLVGSGGRVPRMPETRRTTVQER